MFHVKHFSTDVEFLWKIAFFGKDFFRIFLIFLKAKTGAKTPAA